MKKTEWPDRLQKDWDFIYARSVKMGFVEKIADHIATTVVESRYQEELEIAKAKQRNDKKKKDSKEEAPVTQPLSPSVRPYIQPNFVQKAPDPGSH